jgi:hypothetical protein
MAEDRRISSRDPLLPCFFDVSFRSLYPRNIYSSNRLYRVFKFSASTPSTLTQLCRDLPQFLKANAGRIPVNRQRSLPSQHLKFNRRPSFICGTFRPSFGSWLSPFSELHNHAHLDTPHLVGLLCTSDQPDAGTST